MPGIDANTVLCLHCDGTDASTTFTDSSSAAHTMTAHSNAQVDTAQSVFGGASMLLDGTSWVTTPDSADWAVGSADFTVDCRVRFNSVAGQQTLLAQWLASGNQVGWMIAQDFNVGGLYFDYTTDGSTQIFPNFAWTPSANTWYHVAVVRTGTVVRAFVNGTQIGSDHSIGTATIFNSTSDLTLGVRDSAVLNFPLNGWLDEVRISKGVARWTTTFTPPSAAYDTSTGGTTYTKAGFATAGGIGAGSSASVFVESGFATAGGIGSGPRQRIRLRSGYATVGGVGSGPSASVFVESGYATVGTVGSGSAQKTTPGGTVYSKAGFATLGGVGSGPSASVFQESGWAAAGTVGSGASVRVSPQIGGIDVYTVLCIHADGADASTTFIDSSQYAHTVTTNGTGQVDTAQAKFGGASALFDGSGWLTVADSTDFEFGTGDFTIDFWLNLSSTAGTSFISSKQANFAVDGFAFYRNGANVEFYASSNGSSWDISSGQRLATSVATGAWHHVALIRTGITWRGFWDGIQAFEFTSSAVINDNTQPVSIGGSAGGAAALNGWVDEYRISKGIARWTTNFTPPSAPYTVPPPSVYQETGQASAAGIGGGASASIFAETGYATITGVGRGVWARQGLVFAESGYATITGKGSGIRRMPGHDLILIPEETDHMVLVPSLTGHF